MDFAVPPDHRVKVEESKDIEKRLRSCQRTKKKLWNMRGAVILFVVGALGTVSKGLEKDRKSWNSKEESRPSRLRHY